MLALVAAALLGGALVLGLSIVCRQATPWAPRMADEPVAPCLGDPSCRVHPVVLPRPVRGP